MDILFKQALLRNQTLSSEEPGTFLFEGINASNQEVSVKECKTSCGCTTSQYPKRMKPGETFYVQVIIDKRGQSGSFNQSVHFVYSNGDEAKLKVNGTISNSDGTE